jgi:hypothetical protein
LIVLPAIGKIPAVVTDGFHLLDLPGALERERPKEDGVGKAEHARGESDT